MESEKRYPDNMRALIVGAGGAGGYHANAVNKLGVEAAAYDIKEERVKAFQEAKGTQTYFKLYEALDWASVVHICTPDDRHTEIALPATARGNVIICEKPLATNLRDAKKIQKAVHNAGTQAFVGHNYRLEHPFRYMKERVQAGDVGTLSSVYASYEHDMREVHKKTPWREERQNYLYGGASHPIDLLMHIVDEPVIKVSGLQTGVKLLPNYTQAEDYKVSLIFKSGLIGDVWANAVVRLPIHKTEVKVFGDEATLVGNNREFIVKECHSGDDGWTLVETRREKDYKYTIDEEVRLVYDYLAGLSESHEPVPDIHEGMQVMYVLNAIERSIASGQVEDVSYS